MKEATSLYYRLVKASIHSVMQYKFSFLVSLVFNLAITIADFLVVLAILYHFRAMDGWNIYQIGVLYGINSIALSFYRAFACELHQFQDYIVHGTFDGILLRPWHTLLVLLSRSVQLFRLGGAVQGLIVLIVAMRALGGVGELGLLGCIYIVLLPLTGALIYMAIGMATSSIAFWTGRIRELQTFTVYAPSYAAFYPMSIYPNWLQIVLYVLPVSFIGYVPLRYLLGLGGSAWHLVTPILASIAALKVSLACWHAGERAYHSTGS